MDGALQIKNGSHDVTTPIAGTVCSLYAGTSYDWPVYKIWNLYVDPLQKYERWKNTKF